MSRPHGIHSRLVDLMTSNNEWRTVYYMTPINEQLLYVYLYVCMDGWPMSYCCTCVSCLYMWVCHMLCEPVSVLTYVWMGDMCEPVNVTCQCQCDSCSE